MSAFTAPLKVRGPIEVGDISPNVDTGDVTLSQTNTFDFQDTTEKSLFTIPANSQIIDFYVDTTTTFDAGVSNTLDIGEVGTNKHYAVALDIGTVGRVLGSSDGSQIVNYPDTGTSRITITAKFVPSGSAATAGVATITVEYIVRTSTPA